MPDRPFSNSERVFRVIPSDFDVSVTVNPKGIKYISLNTSPGWTGLYICSIFLSGLLLLGHGHRAPTFVH